RLAEVLAGADQWHRQPFTRAREAVREASLQARVALIRRAVERRADRDHAPAMHVRLEPATDAAVAADRSDGAVETFSHVSPSWSSSGRLRKLDQHKLGDRLGWAGVGARTARNAGGLPEARVK